MRIIDLSLSIRKHFRWRAETEVTGSHTSGDVFQSTYLRMPCHAFTHVDAPGHFLAGGRHVTELAIDQWVGEAAIIDLTHRGALLEGQFPTRARIVELHSSRAQRETARRPRVPRR